jgi:hypothetical protein
LETEQGRLSMGRKPLRPNAIPRLRARRQKSGAVFYYYDHGGTPRREEPLGSDYGLAVKRWAEIEHAGDQKPAAVITFEYVANKYLAAVVPKKAPRTQKDNLAELAKLKEFFCDPPGPLDKIEPQHVQQFLRWRNTDAPIRATREKALLSHLWNWARSQGYTARPNPCAGIKGTKGKGRDVYVSDEEFAALREKADQPLRDAMDLAYLTGQRVSDTLKMDARWAPRSPAGQDWPQAASVDRGRVRCGDRADHGQEARHGRVLHTAGDERARATAAHRRDPEAVLCGSGCCQTAAYSVP